MLASWRPSLIAALILVLPIGAAAEPLERAAIEELEGLLRDLGFDPGAVDGVMDDDTTAAIRRYQDFALLPGEPEPDQRLLEELRGVAAAFAALNAGKVEAREAAPDPSAPAEKTLVPPPAAPPKLTAPVAAGEGQGQTAALPPPAAEEPKTDNNLPSDVVADPALPSGPAVGAEDDEPADPLDDTQARVDAELLRFCTC